MKLYIGGAWQGQEELAKAENPEAEILYGLHEQIRERMRRGEDTAAWVETLCDENPQLVVVSNELGAGIVPMRAEDRAWREQTGRALCRIAERAEQVTRCTCGVGVRIK